MSSLRIDARSTDGDGGLAAVLASASWVSGRPGSSGPRSEVRSPMVWRHEVDGRWRVARDAEPRRILDSRLTVGAFPHTGAADGGGVL